MVGVAPSLQRQCKPRKRRRPPWVAEEAHDRSLQVRWVLSKRARASKTIAPHCPMGGRPRSKFLNLRTGNVPVFAQCLRKRSTKGKCVGSGARASAARSNRLLNVECEVPDEEAPKLGASVSASAASALSARSILRSRLPRTETAICRLHTTINWISVFMALPCQDT